MLSVCARIAHVSFAPITTCRLMVSRWQAGWTAVTSSVRTTWPPVLTIVANLSVARAAGGPAAQTRTAGNSTAGRHSNS